MYPDFLPPLDLGLRRRPRPRPRFRLPRGLPFPLSAFAFPAAAPLAPAGPATHTSFIFLLVRFFLSTPFMRGGRGGGNRLESCRKTAMPPDTARTSATATATAAGEGREHRACSAMRCPVLPWLVGLSSANAQAAASRIARADLCRRITHLGSTGGRRRGGPVSLPSPADARLPRIRSCSRQ